MDQFQACGLPLSQGLWKLHVPCFRDSARQTWACLCFKGIIVAGGRNLGPINQRKAVVGPAYLECVNQLHFLGDWPSITLGHTSLIRGGHERVQLRWRENNIIGLPHCVHCSRPRDWEIHSLPTVHGSSCLLDLLPKKKKSVRRPPQPKDMSF